MGTRYRGCAREVRALEAFVKLMRAADSVYACLGPALASDGVTQGQLGVLEALLHVGPMCQRELASKVLRSTSNVTTVLDNLEQRGLVRRVRRRDDRRVIDVSLTATGQQAIETIFPAHAARIAALLGALTASEQETLGHLCKKLGISIQDDRPTRTAARRRGDQQESE